MLEMACFGKRADRLDTLLHEASKDELGEDEDDGREENRRWPKFVHPIDDTPVVIVGVVKRAPRVLDDRRSGEDPDLIRELTVTLLVNDLERVAAVSRDDAANRA